MKKITLILLIPLLFTSCYRMRPSSGGGEGVKPGSERMVNSEDVALPEGYTIEAVATGLTFPTGITFDENGTPYVTESGYSYGEDIKKPKLLRINNDGSTSVILTGTKNGPWNGIFYANGYFFIAEGGQFEGGKILKVDKEGGQTVLIEDLPGYGDHHTNGPVVHEGYVYFGQGTATNSGIVGKDNYQFGWLQRFPGFHDIPCQDVILTGVNYTTENVMEENDGEKVQTGAFLPYGTASASGQVIPGQVPCSGSVMRVPVNGGDPELVAWGFRNPFGLAFNTSGQLYVTDNGFDDRGSRPAWGTADLLWKVEQGKWYGWPDFSGGLPLEIMEPPGKDPPKMILSEHPNEAPHPVSKLGVHSSSNGFDFSRSAHFGYRGDAFIAQFGDMAPGVGKVLNPVGFRVVKVNTGTGVVKNFVANKEANGPASKIGNGGIERPVAVRFSPDGASLYIVDFGIMLMSEQGPAPQEKTGVIWKVSKTE